MHKATPSTHTALTAAAAAWNNKARESAAPVLRHIYATIRALQRLRDALRHYGELDPASLPDSSDGDYTDYVRTLRNLCARLGQFEQDLEQLQTQALTVGERGEAFIADYLAFLNRGTAPREATEAFQMHLSNWAEGGSDRRRESDKRALDRLIGAQKAEIAALHVQLEEAEALLSRQSQPAQTLLPRSFGDVELQSVREFVENAPMASIPVNASYYERILEAARAPEGGKVLMGNILASAGVVTHRQIEKALSFQREGRRQALGSLLVDLGYTTEDAIAQALAAQLALPYVVLAKESISAGAVSSVPVHLARRHATFAFRDNVQSLFVAMANPLDLIALEDLRIASNKHIRPYVAARGEIIAHIDRYYV